MLTLSDISAVTGLGWDTVKDIIKRQLEIDSKARKLKEVKTLAIDEFYSGKQRKYYTIVIDLDTGRIIWVARGRGGDTLIKFWRALRMAKARIKAVATDMGAAYWSAVVKNLPDAVLVFDKFHLVKLVNEKLDEVRRELVREAVGKDAKTLIKGTRYLLLRRKDNLGSDRLPKLEAALADNAQLHAAYLIKEAFVHLWDQPKRRSAKRELNACIQMARESGIAIFKRLAKTLEGYTSGILAWWKHPINSGRMEGINNKIRTMQRSHYGLRDERFFILKLLNLHKAKHKLVG